MHDRKISVTLDLILINEKVDEQDIALMHWPATKVFGSTGWLIGLLYIFSEDITR